MLVWPIRWTRRGRLRRLYWLPLLRLSPAGLARLAGPVVSSSLAGLADRIDLADPFCPAAWVSLAGNARRAGEAGAAGLAGRADPICRAGLAGQACQAGQASLFEKSRRRKVTSPFEKSKNRKADIPKSRLSDFSTFRVHLPQSEFA